MIVCQQTHVPVAGGTTPLMETLRGLRDLWIDQHGAASAVRLLAPYSGFQTQVVWEQHDTSLEAHDHARTAYRDREDVRRLEAQLEGRCAQSVHRVFTVTGDDDEGCPFRTRGVVVQAHYTPAHGRRQEAIDLLREWQRDWAAPLLPAMKGRVLGFFSTGQTHDLIWQAEFASAGEYDRLYRQWSDSPAFSEWGARFRSAIVSNVHGIFEIVT